MLLLPVKVEMSIPKIEYYFKPGRLMKNGRTNPGILVVDQVRSFQCNNISKDKTVFNYVCNERLTVGVMCKAWTISGSPAPEIVSKDGLSIGVGGFGWFPEGDILELKIPKLHFGKSRRGRLAESVKLFDGFSNYNKLISSRK